ncbi:hypothetical protein SSX86_025761 [Deinandra increscens subsp. villosa]|uniref:NPH3 domain-containing protein n=1 Tax=Deinandra increscens subsp. villosa TaxID=3103831 RepID=A0AAP0CJ55_9ASTR
MDRLLLPDTSTSRPAKSSWLDDSSISDIDYFLQTVSSIKAKGVRPDLIGSIITHYACKWIPELSSGELPSSDVDPQLPPESATASWLKKRFFIETVVSVLPPENDVVPCSFLLRLLKTANMVDAGSGYRVELEKRVAGRLEQATVRELMIPCFSHVTGTLLDVELMVRLVKRFVEINVGGVRSGAGLFKVAKLVDGYLAEAAVDSELTLPEFMELAGAVPEQARATDDGLYRAIDTFLKTHANVTKEERKTLCNLIDSQKLTVEASLHVAQNERLPVRSVIQVLFSEQAKLHSGNRSIMNPKSPKLGSRSPDRCHSSRDIVTFQQMEMKRLKEHVARLERQCHLMQSQIDKLLEKKKGFFSWRRFATSTNLGVVSVEAASERGDGKRCDSGSVERQTTGKGKQGRSKSLKPWRQSTS